MIVSSSLLKLAGYVLAHGLWIVSDFPEGEVMVPFAICEAGAERELIHFEAATQADAIANGKAFMAKPPEQFERCAFARDGQVQGESGYVDAVSTSMWERGPDKQVVVSQFYRPSAKKGFALSGELVMIVDGGIVDDTALSAERAAVISGVLEHPEVKSLWNGWYQSRSAAPKLKTLGTLQ